MTKKGRAAGSDWPAAPELTDINNVPHGVGRCKHFKFGLRGTWAEAVCFLTEYPMVARTMLVECSQVESVNTILSNMIVDSRLHISNLQSIGSRQVFINVLDHLCNAGFINWHGDGFNKSTIEYTKKAQLYQPGGIAYYPKSIITINDNGEKIMTGIDSDEGKKLERRMTAWWCFISRHHIDPGISIEDFNTINEFEVLIDKKKPITWPEPLNKMPYFTFNDRKLRTGGRMYGAFWIGMKKQLRHYILIDGKKTCDIDGTAMHVQLLYQLAGEPVPDGELYLYADSMRDVTKKLMLLMINTKHKYSPKIGRQRVVATYRRRINKDTSKGDLYGLIYELEEYHHRILNLLYKPNWGRLQKAEAGIMLDIMESAMKENIVVLPVHDGCLCQRKHRDRVINIFADQGIAADENLKHLIPAKIEAMRAVVNAYKICQQSEQKGDDWPDMVAT